MAKMMNESGTVYGVEHIAQLVDLSRRNIARNHRRLLDQGRIVLVEGDGRKGLGQFAPYDVIHVGAAVDHIPSDLLDQLAPGGIMV